MDYFVPNFGMDKDIIDSQKHTSDTEARLKHTWNWSPKPTAEEEADKKLIRWNLQNLVQLEKKSDPICDTANWGSCQGTGSSKPA